MKLKTLFIITACFFIFNAPIALIFPETQLTLYGVNPGPGQNYMAQWAGLGSVTIALISWFARDLSISEARRVVLPTLFIYFFLSFIISVYGMVTGVMDGIGWSLVMICLLFATGYGYFLMRNPSDP
jgi:hypothetical protein